jgi:ribose transport system ATP-binding protein
VPSVQSPIPGESITDATVHCGEVVGFTGTVDSGLPDLGPLLGGERDGAGTVTLGGKTIELRRGASAHLLRAGVAFIPQDRHGKGLATELTFEENVTLPHLLSRGNPWWIGRRWQREETQTVADRFDVYPRDRTAHVAMMSGGNQQKVLMGKWLLRKPRLLVLDDPTQAVDVGARHTVRTASRAAADRAAVVFCSAEVEDLAAICDRVLVPSDGVVTREIQRPFDADMLFEVTFKCAEGTQPSAPSLARDQALELKRKEGTSCSKS